MALVIALCVDSTWSLSYNSLHTLPYILHEVLFPVLGYEFLGGSEIAFFIHVPTGQTQSGCWMLRYPVCCFTELESLWHGFCHPSSPSARCPSLWAHPGSFPPVLRKASSSHVASLSSCYSQGHLSIQALGARGLNDIILFKNLKNVDLERKMITSKHTHTHTQAQEKEQDQKC